MKLSQCLGLERKTRARVHRDLTDLYRVARHPDYFAGITRTYQPVDDAGERLPPESKLVQRRVTDLLVELRRLESARLDAVATKEWGNTKARGTVTVDGVDVLKDVPVGYLLFLEKRLEDLLTFFKGLPTLDPNELWEEDRSDGLYRSLPAETLKTKKVPRSHILVAATEHHPAQAETYHDDVTIGTWTRVLRSGAVPAVVVDDLARKAVKLRDAVVSAREAANTIDVEEQKVASAIFDFLLGAPRS